MRVAEAKKKICPFMSGHAGNAVDIVDCEKFCVAGDCMAWQYTEVVKTSGGMHTGDYRKAKVETDTGYCIRLKGTL